MTDTIFTAFWYFLPAGIGNMTPIFVSKMSLLKKWTTPLDGGLQLRGKRLFGANKTVRGLFFGILFGALTGLLQKVFVSSQEPTIEQLIPAYTGWTPIYLGALLAAGALLGDAIESLFKRQVGVAAGDSWFPFDQTDYIIGACLLGALIQPLHAIEYVWVFIIWFGLHLISSYIGFLLKLKAKPI